MRKSIKLDVRIDIIREEDTNTSTVTVYSIYSPNRKLSARVSELIDSLLAYEPELFQE